MVQLTKSQHWFRQWLGAEQATSHYMNQCHSRSRRIYAALGGDEITEAEWRVYLSVNQTVIGSDNGLSPVRRQANTLTILLLIGPLGTSLSEIVIAIEASSLTDMYLKMSFASWWPFWLRLYVLTHCGLVMIYGFREPGISMMTSSNRNIFRVTGHLCGEFTGPQWIHRTKASDAELWCFLWSASD